MAEAIISGVDTPTRDRHFIVFLFRGRFLFSRQNFMDKFIVKPVKNDDGEWVLDVLAAPFDGPFNGKDHDGEFFHAKTDFMLNDLPKRPIIHYHATDAQGKQVDPEIIGQELSHRTDAQGVWVRVALDKAKETAQRIWDAAKEGMARASSGSIQHLVRLSETIQGQIDVWPLAELSLMDLREGEYPANPYAVAMPVLQKSFKAAGLEFSLPQSPHQEAQGILEALEKLVTTSADEPSTENKPQVKQASPISGEANKHKEVNIMTTALSADQLAQVVEVLERREAKKAEEARIKALEEKAGAYDALQEQIDALKAEKEEKGKTQVKPLPHPEQPQTKAPQQVSVSSKWDAFTPGELGFAYSVLKAYGSQPSAELFRAMHAKTKKQIDSGEFDAARIKRNDEGVIVREYHPETHENIKAAIKSFNPMQGADTKAMKADEVMYSTQSSYGDEWVPALWSTELWDLVRNESKVQMLFRQYEVPGESLTIPALGGKTTIYKTAETNDQSELDLSAAVATMTKAQTSNITLTPVKGKAWISWTKDLTENSIVPVLAALRDAVVRDVQEQMDEILISGDTDTANTNNSDTGNGSIATTWHLLMANGLRDYALENSNAVDIAGTLDAADVRSIMALLGPNGTYAIDPSKLVWVMDAGTYRAGLGLGETATVDKAGSFATFQSGLLQYMYGSPVIVSDKYGLTDANGQIHNTSGNNTKGSLLLVRPDRWAIGMSRNMTIRTITDGVIPAVTDTNHLVIDFKMDFKNNGEGSSLGYNITV